MGCLMSSLKAGPLCQAALMLFSMGCFQRSGLEQSPTKDVNCPSLSCGLWAASAHGKALFPAPPLAPYRYLAKTTHIGFLTPRGREGNMAQARPAHASQLPQSSSWFSSLARNVCALLPQPAGSVSKTPKGPTQHFLGVLTPVHLH